MANILTSMIFGGVLERYPRMRLVLGRVGHRLDSWGSDFPHPDGIWPDSQEYLERELGHLPAATRRKIQCENAARLYGFPLD
jgi:predicted TIM-barrel fold metal-dependent hydrolase